MTKQVFSVLFLLLFGIGVSAQTTEKVVEKIRNIYADISEKARLAETDEEQRQYDDLVVNSAGHGTHTAQNNSGKTSVIQARTRADVFVRKTI